MRLHHYFMQLWCLLSQNISPLSNVNTTGKMCFIRSHMFIIMPYPILKIKPFYCLIYRLVVWCDFSDSFWRQRKKKKKELVERNRHDASLWRQMPEVATDDNSWVLASLGVKQSKVSGKFFQTVSFKLRNVEVLFCSCRVVKVSCTRAALLLWFALGKLVAPCR